MNRASLLLGLVLAFLPLDRVALAQQSTSETDQSPQRKETLPPGYQEVEADKVAALQRLCQATADTGLFSGAVLVACDGKILYEQAFGLANREWDIPNTTDTKFRLASVSKQFCSMLIMQLVQEGRIKLDDNITDHLLYYRKDTGSRITIHHLLAHQSGIKDFTSNFDYRSTISRSSFGKDEFIKLHCMEDLIHDPGTIYSYCNAGYCILGRIVEKVTGQTFEVNLRERIFQPLGMANSGVDRNRHVIKKRASGYTFGPFGIENAEFIEMDSTPGPAGGLYSTVEDMFLWDRSLYTDKLLNQSNRELMFTPNRDVPEVKAAGGRAQSVYGYGWNINTRTHPITKRRTKVINHGGAINGFRSMENRLVDDDAFVIVLCNQGDPYGGNEVWNAVTRLSTELIHIVTDQPFRMPGKPRRTQDQRMYQIAQAEDAQAVIDWFEENGKQAPWGGSLASLADRLIDDGQIKDALRLMDFDVEQTPKKVWLIRKTAQACLDHGRPIKALLYANKGLKLRPNDERFESIKIEAEHAVNSRASDSQQSQ